MLSIYPMFTVYANHFIYERSRIAFRNSGHHNHGAIFKVFQRPCYLGSDEGLDYTVNTHHLVRLDLPR